MSGAKWYWCLHCERVFRGREKCPRSDCDGGRWDRWTWEDVRANNPAYPEVPEEGKVYRLYGPDNVWSKSRKR